LLARLTFAAEQAKAEQLAKSLEEIEGKGPDVPREATLPFPAGGKNDLNAASGRAAISDQVREAILGRVDEVNRTGRAEIRLRLEPPELGTVRVHLSQCEEGVHGRVVVQEETTRQLLEAQLPALRHRLAEAGISLGRFEVARQGTGGHHQGQERAWTPLLDPPAFADRPSRPAPASPPSVLLPSQGIIDVLV
jgi:flagellar hook-length control protein FliK